MPATASGFNSTNGYSFQLLLLAIASGLCSAIAIGYSVQLLLATPCELCSAITIGYSVQLLLASASGFISANTTGFTC